MVSEAFAGDPSRRARFEREAQAVAALGHQTSCAARRRRPGSAVGRVRRGGVASLASSEIIRYLVMECLEGQTLADRLVRGPLPIPDVLRYASELADALDHAHRRGLIHRDVKPGNVMVTRDGAKLLDFGLSKPHATPNLLALSTVSPGGAPVTAEGELLGTFPYMAPEQLEGREADARTDLFALGAVVYEMATGRRAFEGTTAATVIGAVLHTVRRPCRRCSPGPPASTASRRRALPGKNPDDRRQTARDLRLELQGSPSTPKTARRIALNEKKGCWAG